MSLAVGDGGRLHKLVAESDGDLFDEGRANIGSEVMTRFSARK